MRCSSRTSRTRRGAASEGAGKAGGGPCDGYDVVKRNDDTGEPSGGERGVNVREARVVHRIFREFAAGKSPRAIGIDLSREGEPGPFGNASATPAGATVSSTMNSTSVVWAGTPVGYYTPPRGAVAKLQFANVQSLRFGSC